MAAPRVANLHSTSRRSVRDPTSTPRRRRLLLPWGLLLLGAMALLDAGSLASAWWPERSYPAHREHRWSPSPWGSLPLYGPPRGYRVSRPLGAPLSFNDPLSGETYCWSEYSGAYFVCAYAPPPLAGPLPLPPPSPPGPSGDPPTSPSPGLLLFRLPQEAEVSVNGVPIGLSAGLGVQSLPPGKYTVALRLSGKTTEHTITLRSHRIFTVTTTGVVASEP